jgi:glycosyltransferase involved in cell wall biosynthesis
MSRPSLSVLIDTHNHEKYIEQALVSAIEQELSVSDYEILVVDDGSMDRTPEIVRKFAPRVRLLSKKNGGQASAFNFGVREARGEVVAFLDGDDWWQKGKLAAAVSALAQHPEVSAVGHGYYEFHDKSGETRLRALASPESANLGSREAAAGALRAWDFLRTSALVARKSVLERIGPVPESLVFCADAFIAPACMIRGVYVLNEPLLYYRVHADNLCTFDDPSNETRLRGRCEMHELLFEMLEPMLLGAGVGRDAVRALLYPYFTDLMRFKLAKFGGSRLNAFRTEMRAFGAANGNPSAGYRAFKYFALGAATLLLPPRQFYGIRDWYARRGLGRLREPVARSEAARPSPLKR